MRKKSPLLWS